MKKEINYKEEAYMILKADKSQDLLGQSANWRTRRGRDAVSSLSYSHEVLRMVL